MLKRFLCVLFCTSVVSCTNIPPECGDAEVITLVQNLLNDNASEVIEAFAPKNDVSTMISLMGLGVGMLGGQYVVHDPKKIHWTLNAPRTTALHDNIKARVCAIDVAYGSNEQVVGRFSLAYRISITDDKSVHVALGN